MQWIIILILSALKQQPTVIHLIADHGGICEKGELDCETSSYGHAKVFCALRQVGCDAWCGGGGGIN